MSNPFLGEIRWFGSNFAPRNWALCNGQTMNIAQNTALFSLLGTTYGGDGRTTFALPDLRGRAPIGFSDGPGLTPRSLGEVGGVETVTLLTTQLPGHNHSFGVSSSAGLVPEQTPIGGVFCAGSHFSTASESGKLAAAALGPTGGSQPHPNQQPTLALSGIIALSGIFPARN